MLFKFFRIRSNFFIRFTCFLLLALFADTVNLDDYLPRLFGDVNSIDLHLDDIDMSDPGLITDMLPVNNNAAHQANSSVDNNNNPNSKKDIVVLYDLDSLALAASTSFEKETILQSKNSYIEEVSESFTNGLENTHLIFLQNRSLLI